MNNMGRVENTNKDKKSIEIPLHYTKLIYQLSFKNIHLKWTTIEETSGSSMAPNTTRRISCYARNTPADYTQLSM